MRIFARSDWAIWTYKTRKSTVESDNSQEISDNDKAGDKLDKIYQVSTEDHSQ